MRVACALLLVLALGSATVQAQKNTVTDALKKSNLTLAAALLDIANVSGPASAKNAKWTALLPTDAAITSFLKEMGLTVDDLKARPGLAKEIVGTHVILGSNVRQQEIFDGGRTARIVKSAAGRGNELVFTKTATGASVVSHHGATASVDPKHIVVDENKSVHVIDKVLYGDGYYPSFKSLCKERDAVTDFCRAVLYAGLSDVVDGKDFAHTVFVPNNKAFTPIALSGANAAAPAAVADILKYHVLAGPAKEMPKGLKAGPHETLLAGQSLNLKYTRNTKGKLHTLDATVVGASGDAKVLRSNVYVGKSIVNGIDAVLSPKPAVATTKPSGPVAPQPVAGTGATTKPAVVPTTKPAGAVTPQPVGAVATTKPAGPVAPQPVAGTGATTKPAVVPTTRPSGAVTPQPVGGASTKPAAEAATKDAKPAAAAEPEEDEQAAEPAAETKDAAKPAADAKPAAAPADAAAKPAAAAATKAGSRRLLAFGWGGQAGSTALEDNTASQIQAAVDGNESAAAAADQSVLGSEELSVPGEANQAEDGITPCVRAMAAAAGGKPTYDLLQYTYVPDILEKRGPYREAHLANARAKLAAGKLVMAGAVGDPVEGAVFVFKNSSKEEIEAFVAADPVVQNGLVPSWSIKPYAVVVGEP